MEIHEFFCFTTVYYRSPYLRQTIHQYHVTPFEIEDLLSYLRSANSDDLTEIWKL